MLMIIEKRGEVDQLDFAAKIHNWMLHGFEELGDVGTCNMYNMIEATPYVHHSQLDVPYAVVT